MAGFILWALQSTTALFLSIGLYIHIFVTPLTGNTLYNLLFVFSAVFHGFNGLWVLINESFRGKGWRVAEKFKTLFIDFQYNKQAGHFIFIIHRLTGLFLLLYLTQHIFTNSLVSAYLSIDNLYVVKLLKNDFLNYLAVLSLCFHAVNGMRLVFIEFTGLTWFQRRLAYASLTLGIIFALYTAVVR